MRELECPFRVADQEVAKLREEATIVLLDFHAEATAEKMALAWHLDGRVSAVLGTHTHVQTADERILPEGNRLHHGRRHDRAASTPSSGFEGARHPQVPDPAADPFRAGGGRTSSSTGSISTFDEATGQCRHIERLAIAPSSRPRGPRSRERLVTRPLVSGKASRSRPRSGTGARTIRRLKARGSPRVSRSSPWESLRAEIRTSGRSSARRRRWAARTTVERLPAETGERRLAPDAPGAERRPVDPRGHSPASPSSGAPRGSPPRGRHAGEGSRRASPVERRPLGWWPARTPPATPLGVIEILRATSATCRGNAS